MRVLLYWSSTAGDGVSIDEIEDLFAEAGHELVKATEEIDDLMHGTVAAVDCVVAAGGDGTVARAGRALAGGAIPLAILPIGTANNIAKSLGVGDDPGEVIRSWRDLDIKRIDMGVIHDEKGESYFLESVGTGLVADEINKGKGSKETNADVAERLEHARETYLKAVLALPPRHLRITIDDNPIEGDYVLAEVLNIPSIGPRVRLTPEVSPADGLLSLVLAGEQDRNAISAHMASNVHETFDDAGLQSLRGKSVTIDGWHPYHVDDEVRTAHGPVSISIKPGFLPILG